MRHNNIKALLRLLRERVQLAAQMLLTHVVGVIYRLQKNDIHQNLLELSNRWRKNIQTQLGVGIYKQKHTT